MAERTDRERLDVCADPACKVYGPHVHDDAWNAYWTGLTEEQRQRLRDKASWEHMTLSAVAAEWGA